VLAAPKPCLALLLLLLPALFTEHQYSEANLRFEHLKGSDRAMARALSSCPGLEANLVLVTRTVTGGTVGALNQMPFVMLLAVMFVCRVVHCQHARAWRPTWCWSHAPSQEARCNPQSTSMQL
jgi:hypothetical protein